MSIAFRCSTQLAKLSPDRCCVYLQQVSQRRLISSTRKDIKAISTAVASPKAEKGQMFVNAASIFDAYKEVSLEKVNVVENNKLEVEFSTSDKFLFNGLWLRDSCRDDTVLSVVAGERILSKIPFATRSNGLIKSAQINDEKKLVIEWADEDKDLIDNSTFDAGFLRQYAPVVAKSMSMTKTDYLQAKEAEFKWLEPYRGFANSPAPSSDLVDLWANDGTGGASFQRRDYTKVTTSDSDNLEMLQALMRHGVVIVDNVPVNDGTYPLNKTVLDFANDVLGGMQKDPARDEPNWVIKKKPGAQSISYSQETRLNNHTDQSVPAHGIPALLLVVHYVQGQGKNTLVDSYAVSKEIKKRDPEAFRLLCKYGNNQERDFVRSRIDSVQAGTQGMLISTRQPIIQVDANGNHVRSQYNEVFRTPSTIPFENFEAWYKAYLLWNDLIHGPEFEVEVPINEGQILVIDNWRVLHGRAGRQSSPDRCIMGGTVVREAFCSRAVSLMGASLPVQDWSA